MTETASPRLATVDDATAIDALMKASIADLFPAFYDARRTASSVIYVGHVDRMLIEDGTYFVIDEDESIIACGGWSRRDKLYTGSGEGATDARLLDPVTEPARVRAMFVRGDRTRRGLGTRILDASTSTTGSRPLSEPRSRCRTASRSPASRWRCRSATRRSAAPPLPPRRIELLAMRLDHLVGAANQPK